MKAAPSVAAEGMLRRYSSAKVAAEMAHWHAMDYSPESENRKYWESVKRHIALLTKTRSAR